MFYNQRKNFSILWMCRRKIWDILGWMISNKYVKAQNQLELGLGPKTSRGLSYILMDTLIDMSFPALCRRSSTPGFPFGEFSPSSVINIIVDLQTLLLDAPQLLLILLSNGNNFPIQCYLFPQNSCPLCWPFLTYK